MIILLELFQDKLIKLKQQIIYINRNIKNHNLLGTNNNRMNGVYLIIFEIFIIIVYGIFVRTDSTNTVSTYLQYISTSFYFIFAYTVVSFRYKMFDWSMLTNLLFIIAICIQLNTLYIMFWSSCFNNFYSTSSFGTTHLVTGIQCALCIIITIFQFIGQMNSTQIFVLAMIQVFAFALNWVISELGIKAITSGGGMTVFFFAFVFAIPIKKLKFSENPYEQQKQKYFSLTLKFIGLVVLIMTWPGFNVMGAIPDLSLKNILSTAMLFQQAYLQTLLCLMAAIATTLALRIYGQKIILSQFVNSIINTGILISSCAAIIIDPFASVLLGIAGPLLYFVYDKYIAQFHLRVYSLDKIIMCILSGTLSSIFAAGRNGRTPALATNHSAQGGYQFSCLLVSGLFALTFGLIAGYILKCINSLNDETTNKDNALWLIEPDILPLYSDDPMMATLYQKEADKKLKLQQTAFNLKQSFIQQKIRQNADLGKILKQQVDYQSRIK